jgi:hypothetical protein
MFSPRRLTDGSLDTRGDSVGRGSAWSFIWIYFFWLWRVFSVLGNFSIDFPIFLKSEIKLTGFPEFGKKLTGFPEFGKKLTGFPKFGKNLPNYHGRYFLMRLFQDRAYGEITGIDNEAEGREMVGQGKDRGCGKFMD